ncbi:Potassium uptake protein, integral membrane component, KtrB [Chitinispirillum alkaliphilum]|nr:Potassium uptake protein, integral membrane component, KtrB [Chitinispirillum alkaliphilum]
MVISCQSFNITLSGTKRRRNIYCNISKTDPIQYSKMKLTDLSAATTLTHRLKPEALLALSFLLVILLGTVLLYLPFSTHNEISLLDALFTSTSATCVTGLIVVDTGTDFTFFGQTIILLLFQFGGIGVMSFAALAFYMLGIRLSLRAQEATSSAIVQSEIASEVKPMFVKIIKLIFTFEIIGALILFFGFLPYTNVTGALWSAVFHSVSAFCNAGFSLYPDSLIGFRDSFIVLTTISILIIVGGIGYPVLSNLSKFYNRKISTNGSLRILTLHTKVTILTTVLLLVMGALFLFAFEMEPGDTILQRASLSIFQSITARTAGFNTTEIGLLPGASLFIIIILMFIGGSPGSCAGGIKTTTFTLWMAQMWSRIHEGYGTQLFGRYIPHEIIRRASTIIGIAIWWNILGLFILLATQSHTISFKEMLFEQISAFGTVGLSTGITPSLNAVGRLWIIATMYIGRVGPLTIIVLMLRRKPQIRYPEGRIMVG